MENRYRVLNLGQEVPDVERPLSGSPPLSLSSPTRLPKKTPRSGPSTLLLYPLNPTWGHPQPLQLPNGGSNGGMPHQLHHVSQDHDWFKRDLGPIRSQ